MSKPDLSEFYRHSRPRKPPCKLGPAFAELTETEQAQLHAALAADLGLISTAAVEKWLSVRGHTVSVSAITSHRKRTCTCADD